MPSKLLAIGCIGFLYKVVHKTGRFSVFIFTIFLLTFERLMPWS